MYHRGEITDEAFELAPMQQGMMVSRLLSEHSGVNIEQIVIELREDLRIDAFEGAWRRVIQRHEILRSSFHWEGLAIPQQAVHRDVSVPFTRKDWRGLSSVEHSFRLQALLHEERHRGFDLTVPPLMRLVLCEFGPRLFQLVWTFDHAVLDGRAFTLILKEVFAIYDALRNGREPELAPVRPYRAYIQWLNDRDVSRSERYWRSLLQGFTAPTPWMADTMPAGPDSGGAVEYGEHFQRLSKSLTAELVNLAAQHNITLNTIVQGAWALLLSRYSGEEDIVFGATRACRKSSLEGAESMIGLLINTLPVRTQLMPNMPVVSWLKELREQHLAVREHEHTPLIQVQQWSEVPQGTPLFETLVVFERASLDSVMRAQGGDWLNRRFRVIDQTSYPLTLFAYGDPELLLKFSYDQRRLKAGTVARLGTHLETLLAGIAENPEQSLATLPMLPEPERWQVLVEWNCTGTDYPKERCLHEFIEAQAKVTPDAVAITCGEEKLTYRELNQRANQLAHHLQKRGVGPEVLVGVCLEVSLDLVVGLLGILKAGGAYVPLDPSYPRERLAYMIGDSRMPLILASESTFKTLPLPAQQAAPENGTRLPKVICLDTQWKSVTDESDLPPASPVNSENLAYVLYTSGSTGQPKGVMITHRNVANFFAGMDLRLGKEAGVWLAVTSVSFDISVLELFWTLARGYQVVLQKRTENLVTSLAQQISRHGITHLQCTPSLAEMLARDTEAREALRSVQCLLLGGEALAPELVRQLDFPGVILNMYGPTETTVWSTTWQVDKKADRFLIGRPIANTEIYVLDRQLQPAPIGVPGELFIGGAGVARGYFRRPELTSQRFIPHPFRSQPGARLYKTGDRARYLPDGNIECLGRLDHQVKLRGFRIEPGEIEATLRQHPAVGECAVVLREIAPRDNRLVAFVVPAAKPAPTARALREFLKERLPDYMIPSAFVSLEKLPLTPNGKLNRQALPPPEAQPETEATPAPPRSATEKKLAEIWASVLGRKAIGIHDNFFEAGGHSLLATQVVSQIRAALDKNFSIVQLFRYPTIHALAQCLTPKPVKVSVARAVPDRGASRRQYGLPRQILLRKPPVQRIQPTSP